MKCELIKENRNVNLHKMNKEQFILMVNDITDDFKIFDNFKYENNEIEAYKNSDDVFYFQYVNDGVFYKSDSKLVSQNIITYRLKRTKKYGDTSLYKLNTHNPFDNYLVTLDTLRKMVDKRYDIIPNHAVAHGYFIYQTI